MTAITILNQENVPTGPFTRDEVAEKLQRGEITLDDLAFVEGLTQWTPLREVLARVDALTPPVPPVVQMPPTISAEPASPPVYSYAATMQPPAHLVYAGFWLRFVAYLIDSLIITGVTFFFAFVIAMIFILLGGAVGVGLKQPSSFNSPESNPALLGFVILMEFMIWAGMIAVFWLYFAKLESGPAQATYGKRVLGLRVTDLTGQRITFGRATGRTFGKFVSALPMDIGFIMAGFTERKQALHDMIAGTLVVRG